MEFISHTQSLELQKLGFNEPCFGFYTHNGEIRRYTNFDGELNDFQTLKNSRITMGDGWCTVPTYQQAFRWFRDEHNLKFHIRQDNWNNWCSVWILISNEHERVRGYSTYEKAEDACLNKLIEIVKNKP